MTVFRCVGWGKWLNRNASIPQMKKTFLLRVLLCWRMQCGGGHSHFCLLYLYCFSLNRHKNRKTALLNLLSVKGFLGISSMWRKIRVSLELLPSGCSQKLPTLPGVSSVLIRDARLVEAALRLQKRKKKEERKETAIGGHKSLAQCPGVGLCTGRCQG